MRVIRGNILNGTHLRNGDSNCLTLGSDKNNLLMGINLILITQQSRQHQLCSVTYGIDRRILHHHPLISGKQCLKRLDDLSQERLVSTVVVLPLRIKDVVKGNHVAVVLRHNTTADSAEFLHVCANTQQQTKMNT
jgi:hypothetical protein